MTGFCSAAFGLAGPVYIGEIASTQVRGSLCSLVSTLVSIGLLYIMAIGSLLQPWQSALLCLPWSLAGFILLLLVPNSPSYLARKGSPKAEAAALWYHGRVPEVGEKEEEGAWDGYSLRMLVLVVLLAVASKLSGIPVISYYLVDMLAASSSGEAVGEEAAAVLCGVTELVGGLVSLVLTDVVGRRLLLVVSYTMMSLALLVLALLLLPISFPPYTGLLTINLFFLGFSIGCAPILGVLLGELFPMGTKALATTIAITTLWSGSFIVSKLFFSAEAALGKSAAFGLFSVCNLATVVFVLAWVPETKGKSVQQLRQLYKHSDERNIQTEKA